VESHPFDSAQGRLFRNVRGRMGHPPNCCFNEKAVGPRLTGNNEGSLGAGDPKLPFLLRISAPVFRAHRRQTAGRHPAGQPEDARPDCPLGDVDGSE